MTGGISGGLAGLSILSGDSSLLGAFSATPVLSAAAQKAKAGFTLPVVPAPWSAPQPTQPIDARIAEIRRLTSFIDQPDAGKTLPGDLQASFTAYKALDRLRILAEAAGAKTTGDAARAQLQASFAKGLSELQSYLADAPSSALDISFGKPTRRAETVAIRADRGDAMTGAGIVATRDAAIPGLTGTERFTVRLDKPGAHDSVTIDLAEGSQPPTLDSIAGQLNAAIRAIPQTQADGTIVRNADGNPVPRWKVEFVPNKGTDKWGFKLKSPALEQVSICQADAPDAVMVVAGQSTLDAPSALRIRRFGAGDLSEAPLGTIEAYDRAGSARAALLPAAPAAKGTTPVPAPRLAAAISAQASVTDAASMTYVVGTAAGELDANRPTGSQDLFLTKLDSAGGVVWQRMLGATGSAEGAAISLAGDGSLLVAATIAGSFDGAASDGDMALVRVGADGTEGATTLVRGAGLDRASAVVAAADGSVVIGGSDAAGQAVLARIGAGGAIVEKSRFGGTERDAVVALAAGADGGILALTREGGRAALRSFAGSLGAPTAQVDLGTADPRALAVGSDGRIWIAGASSGGLTGTAVNAPSGGRDGFLARLDADLGNASVRYIGTGAADEVDSIAIGRDGLFVGGRTGGTLGGARAGSTDGFVARIDDATLGVSDIAQFGRPGSRTDPVRVSVASGGDNAVHRLGLHLGALNAPAATRLVDATTLRAGDRFAVALDGGRHSVVTVAADDTLAILAARVQRLIGKAGTASAAPGAGGQMLRIDMKPGHDLALLAGPAGSDALGKLGLAPVTLTAPAATTAKTPKVTPGGSFALNLDPALSIDRADRAAVARGRIKDALSMTQTAYRSLYWDDAKAKAADGATAGSASPYQGAQLARYQDALTRISAITRT